MLTQSERDAAFKALYIREHDQGHFVCQRNEIADSWIGVIRGFLRVQDTSADGKPVMFTGVAAGGWIGEGSLLKIEQRASTRLPRLAPPPPCTCRATPSPGC